ncbi:MAG TPA: hypothetical protein VFI02_15960 [Armatimonadota bacterium]|nr:hypothetical protein [Armatimonadota bacterium]
MTSILVRAAIEEDIPRVVELWERFMTEEQDAVPDADPQSARSGWTERLRRQIERRHVFVALQGQTVVGFIGWTNTHLKNRRVQTLLQRKGFLPLEGFGIPRSYDQLYYRKPFDSQR